MDYPLGVCRNQYETHGGARVLIPILMDYPLGGLTSPRKKSTGRVLIPILMDYPLGGKVQNWSELYCARVLIPILMDYPLGDLLSFIDELKKFCLNPYSNGLPSRGSL